MIINPYIIENESLNDKENKEKKELSIEQIVKNIVDGLIKKNIELLTTNNKEKVKENIKIIIFKNYNEKSEEKINQIIEDVLNKIYGYGIFQKYIRDNITTDIRAVRFDEIYIKQLGVWKKSEDKFFNKEEFENYIRFCAIKNESIINFENPVVVFSDKKNRLRIEAGISPSSIISPSIVIRIHNENENNTLEDLYLKAKMLNNDSYNEILKAVSFKKNIILCGQGGSGKTTLLKAIINEFPKETAITTNEETAELYLRNRNIIQRECVLGRNENKNIDLEKLARHALVMSNDVIVIGEIKGAEANVFFDSLSTGHTGLATVHTDSVYNVINRLITLIKKDVKAQYYTEEFLKRFLAESIHVIVFLNRFKVIQIVNVKYKQEENKIHYEKLFERKD